MGSIAILLIALIVIIIIMLNSSDRSKARSKRTSAIETLLSRNEGTTDSNLNLIALSLSRPISAGGSLNNLNHYLSKDPGRREFSGAADRRRLRAYRIGDTAVRADRYTSELRETDIPAWAPEFNGTVKALYENVRDDILILTGTPEFLTELPMPIADEASVSMRFMTAVGQFGEEWIPRGETESFYDTDRQRIRAYLLSSKRFQKRIEVLDMGWVELAASLYNLSVNTRWLTAVQYDPDLGKGLNELIILVLTADIHRRSEDLMNLVVDESDNPGILWLPNFSYYKNIPEVSGQTADSDPTIFIAKVNLGYTFRDSGTQTWLNRRKDWLTDYFSAFFTKLTSEDFSPVDEINPDMFLWKSARLKAEGIHGINSRIITTSPFGLKGVYGVRDLAMVRVNLLANP